MSRNSSFSGSFVRVNGKIRAREVRVIGVDGTQLGIIPTHEALVMARNKGVDLVEIAPNATPPVCRLVDYGKFRYEQAKKDKESKKHQHANRVKEIQLSPSIDSHDFSVKLTHAIDFLCDEMKIKITLKFRGREMAHQEYGFQVVERFLKDVSPYGHPDAPPKLLGRGINVMVTPLPRNKRARNPNQAETPPPAAGAADHPSPNPNADRRPDPGKAPAKSPQPVPVQAGNEFTNNPFAKLDTRVTE